MHWGSDIGAAWLARELARLSGGAAGLATVSRLVTDVNRDPKDPTTFLYDTGEGRVRFNRGISETEQKRRLEAYFHPFHRGVDADVHTLRPRFVLSVHSFTPEYRGEKRDVEVGVLFDQYDDLAMAWVAALRQEGFRAEPNEPYSGKKGLIYSPARHGNDNGLPYLELEVRQDLIATRPLAKAVAARIFRAMGVAGV